MFHGRHFVRHLVICYRIYIKLPQLMCAVIMHNLLKKRSLYINKWLSYSQLQCFTAAILSAIFEFVIEFVSIFYNWCPVSLSTIQWKKVVSILINGWVTAKYSVSRPPFCPPYWNLLSDLCQNLTGYVQCHCERFKRKTASLSQAVFRRSTNAAYTQTHTHDDGIRRTAMRCISPKNQNGKFAIVK